MTDFSVYNSEAAGEGKRDDRLKWPPLPEGHFWTAGWEKGMENYWSSNQIEFFRVKITRHSHHRTPWTPWKTKPCNCYIHVGSKLFRHRTLPPDLSNFRDAVQQEIDSLAAKLEETQRYKAARKLLDEEIARRKGQ